MGNIEAMGRKVTAVINTLNEEKNIERAIKSVSWVDEVIVCDMHSDDNTVTIAQNLDATIIFHKRTGYVEPARNFAISKTAGDWVLILDADEEIPNVLADKLKKLVNGLDQIDYVEIPRKNIIFNKWIQNSFWWPDYNVRFFKRGKVKWLDKIHSKPQTEGMGIRLEEKEEYAIIHHHYDGLDQYIERLNRYTKVQARQLIDEGYKFSWKDLISKPLSEFLSRYFANYGYKDGLHGLALSLLQSYSEIVKILRVWEHEKFKEVDIDMSEFKEQSKGWGYELKYWITQTTLPKNLFLKLFHKAETKLRR